MRALVVGLDGAPPELVFDRWLHELPTIRSLAERGTYGILRSCDPPITVPAWAVMASSRSPGALGIYGFRNRRDHSYDPLSFATSRAVGVPRIWDLLTDRDKPVIVLGVPPTYPVAPVNGALVSCFLAPDVETHPPELAEEIRAVVGRYLLDVPGFRTAGRNRLLADLAQMTDTRFRLAEHLLETRPWELFFLVEIGTDRLHHRFWRDPSAMLGYYRRLDERIGRLLRLADEDTAVLLVSDHGAQACHGGICINEWLRREGFLVLKEEPAAPTALTSALVDWTRTTAWGEGGHHGRIFLNVEGREPEGVVPGPDYERVRGELKERIEALGDERGRPIGTRAHRFDELYDDPTGIPPDLLVYFGDLRWQSVGAVGTGAVHVAAPDEANHAHEGLYLLAGDGAAPGRGPAWDIRDVAPTLLTLLGEPVPVEMEGRSLVSPACGGRRRSSG